MSSPASKRLVAAGYDHIAARLLRRQRQEPPTGTKRAYLECLTKGLPDGSRVLDLGCGPGTPHDAWLSKRFRVVGVDISRAQLALARRHVRNATFLLADMGSLQFKPGSFDAIAAMYSIIHVPREEHERLLKNIYAFLTPGGRFFAVLGANEWEGTETDWLDLGAEMYWSHFDAGASLALLRSAGFSVTQSSIEPDTGTGTGAHLFAIAERPA